jgi:hypothetical protein
MKTAGRIDFSVLPALRGLVWHRAVVFILACMPLEAIQNLFLSTLQSFCIAFANPG